MIFYFIFLITDSFQVLWPGGTFFIPMGNIQSKLDDAQADQKFFQGGNQSGGHRASKLVSFEEQLEAARRASDLKKMLLGKLLFSLKTYI